MTDSERVAKVIAYSKLSKNAFATHIGFKKGQSIYNLIDGYRPITVNIATKISKAFPEISKTWLLTEEGNMFVSNNYNQPDSGKKIIEEPISDFNIKTMNPEIDRLQKQVDRLMLTIENQAASIRDYAAAEKENARSRANLTDTVIVQATTIANLTHRSTTKNGTVGGLK